MSDDSTFRAFVQHRLEKLEEGQTKTYARLDDHTASFAEIKTALATITERLNSPRTACLEHEATVRRVSTLEEKVDGVKSQLSWYAGALAGLQVAWALFGSRIAKLLGG